MSNEIKFEMEGFDKLEKELSLLEKREVRQVKTKALRAGAKIILAEAKDRVPQNTGNLKKSLGLIVKTFRGDKEVQVAARTGKSRKNDGFYAPFIEFGTEHNQAQPFLRPAAENKAKEAIDTVGKVLMEEIEKVYK